MDKKKKQIVIVKILMVIFVIGIVVSAINIGIWYFENKENNDIQEQLSQFIEQDVNNSENEEKIDFSSLKEKNADTVAYLTVNNTNINYVVVKGDNNSFYLKHNFNKNYNRSGWIFMDYHNRFDGQDKNVIIYGHNTLDKSMFGTLKQVIKKEWYLNKDNHIISLITEDEVLFYQVFSTYKINVEDYYIKTDFKDNIEFNEFVNVLKTRSVYDYGVDIGGDDSILTLSTCAGNGKQRMVLHAKKIQNVL